MQTWSSLFQLGFIYDICKPLCKSNSDNFAHIYHLRNSTHNSVFSSISRVFWAPIRSPPVNPPSPTSRIIQAISDPHGTCDKQCRIRSLQLSLRATKNNPKNSNTGQEYSIWFTLTYLFSGIQFNKHLCAGFYQSSFSLRLVWKLTLRAFAIPITFAETSSTKYFLKTGCLLFTCLLRKSRFYGNTIMRDNILAPIIIFECTLLHVYIQYQYRTKQLSLFYYVHKPNENKCC